MDRKQFRGRFAGIFAAAVTAAAVSFVPAFCAPAFAAEPAATAENPAENTAAVTVEYESLGRLVLNNQDLKSETENYNTTVANYQSLLASLEDERDYMKFLAEKYEEDAEAKASYKSNATNLNNSIKQINEQLGLLTKKTGTISLRKTVDSYTLTAQTLMNTYNQMVSNVTVKEKTVQAAEASYQAKVKQQTSGTVTAAEVLAASDTLAQEKNLLSSYQQQAAQARFDLLSTLGLEAGAQVTIGTIPQPDLTAIDAIDFETDQEKAVNNNASVQNARHSGGGTYTEQAIKSKTETEAEGNARASIQAAYQEIQSARRTYQAALDSFESASIIYQSLQNKNQAGMLTRTEYLEGEAAYLAALADRETASMNLYQAWETYRWEVKGVS